MAKDKPIIAIMYDFDKTLCTKDMQEYSFMPKLNIEAKTFWQNTDELVANDKMDPILAYMYLMLKESKKRDVSIRRKDFVELGDNIEYFPGVLDYFDEINKYADSIGLQLEHYIISSGLKEIIEGSKLKDKFKEIYSCEFLYDVNDVAVWPKMAVNFTTKTQFLFLINKGCDLKKINNYIPNDDRRIPFRNMIYIGDGQTDVPCMKLVKVNGGQSIAVFNGEKSENTARELLKDRRVDFIAKANYESDKALFKILTKILDKMKITNELVEIHRELEPNY